MGLDSVELLMEFENYFKIQIPDSEAEKILTIQNMIDVVARHLNIEYVNAGMRDSIFKAVANFLQHEQNVNYPIQPNDKIANYLEVSDNEIWNNLGKAIGLLLPRPDNYDPQSTKLRHKFKKLIGWTPLYDWHSVTVGQFIDAVCARNYQQLLKGNILTSKYEIFIAIAGITVDKIGVDYFEVSPEKSFTSDLGVD